MYCFIKPQNYFKRKKNESKRGISTKTFLPERTFHPLIIMLLAETEVKKETASAFSHCSSIISRGGVEDTRLEAKAKDTKKIRGQGQGQPLRGQTLSRPRTGMLEAKAKDQGHKRKCSPKIQKKGLHKNFSGDLQKKKKKRSSQKFFKRSPQKNVF